MDSKLDLYGDALNIVARCGGYTLTDVLQSKFGCVATIAGVDFREDPGVAQQKRQRVVPEEKFVVKLLSGVRVSVWKGDLTSFPTEAVVNAANQHLQHYGGLALALSNAGGPQIQKESNDYIKKNRGPLNPGDAIVADAGLLPYKKIIHAVGPELHPYPSKYDVSDAKPVLEKAIRSILDRVKDERLKTVAIPAISSGLFHYPLPECARTIVTTVKEFCERSRGYVPEKIFFVNNDDPTVNEMESACRQIFTGKPMMYSQAAASQGRGDTRTSTPTVQIGNVHLTLKSGQIEEQQTDVIVSTAFNRDMTFGYISEAILKKAGYEIQKEMKRAQMTGSIIITKSYNLRCKAVYHTFIGKGKDKQIIFNSVLECLKSASSEKYKSIAFPAIGTGGCGFDKKDVARIMSEAVTIFAQQFNRTMEVHFVIFPSDYDTYKAFEAEMRSLQQKASHHRSPPAYEPRDDPHGSRAPTPHISLMGPSKEAIREAEQWLQRVLLRSSDTFNIYNNFILHFGDEQHQQLSRLMRNGVLIDEVFVKGRASITVNGSSAEGVAVAGLQVEAMLCKVQKEFVEEEKSDAAMLLMSSEKVFGERKAVDASSTEFTKRVSALSKMGLQLLKMDKVENSALEKLFELKKNQLSCSKPQIMFQIIPPQCCEMLSNIGFHAEYAPPEDPEYGEGIYFTDTVPQAIKVWKVPNKKFLHVVEAEVLTGNSTSGQKGLILPPALKRTDPTTLYDSMGGPGVSVIFSGYQALPKYIMTCELH